MVLFQDNPADFAERFNDPNILPHISRDMNKRSKRRGSGSGTSGLDLDSDGKRPPIVGDSIFTQEEFSNNRGQSLVEFEQLEAEFRDHHDDLMNTKGENEATDHMDLIGAYLKGD